jgi:hypothetical protein
MKMLPDKIWDAEKKKWYFVFNSDKEGRALAAKAGFGNGEKLNYDKEKYKDTNRLWFETDETAIQGILFIDSYSSLLTEDDEEKEESSNAMGKQARAYSLNIKKIIGRLRRKGFILLGINAIRTKPGVTYGNPEYEGGGTELQLKSSLRFKNSKVSVPQGYPKGQTEDGETTEFSTEKSPFGDGRTDNYIYIKIRNLKCIYLFQGISRKVFVNTEVGVQTSKTF